jgi:DNA-binding CsgD family transcriptional regulator/putative component of membrane protein insertase Oxa1/YidC/SpoIIIJ protein YidD
MVKRRAMSDGDGRALADVVGPGPIIPERPRRHFRREIGSREREVIDAFLEAGRQPAHWPSALQSLAGLLNAEGCVLREGPTSSFVPICSPSMDPILEHAKREGCVEKNGRVERCLAAFALGHDIVTESMVFSASELDSDPYNVEFINRFNFRWFAAMILAGEGPSSIILTVERLAESEPFSVLEIETLRRLRPQLQEAGNLALRLAAAYHAGQLAAFGAFNIAVILLDRTGRVLSVGPGAELLMNPHFVVRAGFLKASLRQNEASLQRLIQSVLADGALNATAPVNVAAMVRRGATRLLVHATQLPHLDTDRFQHARAALMLVDLDAQRPPPDLRHIFGMTRSEADIAALLASGRDIDEIAEARRTSPGTLRAQLRSIFVKTETRRQAELVGLLLRCSALPR